MKSTAAHLRPGLAVRVGITGHRQFPRADRDELGERIREVLSLVADIARDVVGDPSSGYTAGPPVLRAVSPLAEGADRLFARTALELGWELQCPLPFERGEYARDFTGEGSRAEFEDLLTHPNTTAVVELDGDRASEGAAYQAVGRLMLEQCDVLFAVWNGDEAEGRGGTAQIVAEATRQEIPTIWIHSEAPHPARLTLCMGGKPGCVVEPEGVHEHLSSVVKELFVLPSGEANGLGVRAVLSAGEDADRFGDDTLSPTAQGSALGLIWRWFLRLWSAGQSVRASPPLPDGPYRPVYDHVDSLARHYAGLYRGSLVSNYLLGTCAVLSALLAYAHHSWHTTWILVELAAIVSILTLIVVARARRWHARAIDCRYLAEQLRQMLFLHPLGRVTPSSRPPAHYAFGDPRSTWMNWRFRALVREIGMPGPAVRFDRQAMAEVFERIQHQWVSSQAHYHEDNSELLHAVEHRLHLTAKACFFATIGSCLGHLVIHDPAVVPWLTVLSAGLPACGAALHAISSHGEFRRLSERSAAMALQLQLTGKELDALAGSPHGSRSADLGRLTLDAAQTMMDEVSDWRIIYRKPPLEPA